MAVFWIGLFAPGVVWVVFGVGSFFRFNFEWLLLILTALTLSMANIVGYVRCKQDVRSRIGAGVAGLVARTGMNASMAGAVQSAASSLAAAAATTLSSFEITVGTGGTTVDVLSAANGGAITGAATAGLTDPTAADYGAGVAKSLAERINELRDDGVEGLEGVYATAKTTYDYTDLTTTVAAADAYVGSGELANGDVTINGVDIGPVTVQEKDADGSLVNAINAKSDITGVTAALDENGRLSLTAEDGRDIVFTTTNNAADLLFDGADNATVADETGDFKSGSVTISAQDTIATLSNVTATDDANVQAVGTVANADITTVAGANITIESIDSALAQIDSFRAGLGAIQNRFESTIRNLSAVSESLSAANSRIRDADFAAETAKLSKNQVLQQAGISVLAQANALPQQALSLLG